MLFLLLLTLAVGLFARVARPMPMLRTLAVPIALATTLVLATTVVPSSPLTAPAAVAVLAAVLTVACTPNVKMNARRQLSNIATAGAELLNTMYAGIRVWLGHVMPLDVPALPG